MRFAWARAASGARAVVVVVVVVLALGLGAAGCVPSLPHDTVPEEMTFDPPNTVPTPTNLVVNPMTGHIDFSLAPPPATPPSAAEAAFDKYLESLDGFPTVTPAAAPASAPLDPATLTPGTNVVVVAAKAGGAQVTDLMVGFDDTTRSITLRPKHWAVGEMYWAAVRGYDDGVRAAGGDRVVASPTMYLLKQTDPLTCGAADPDHLDPMCPAYGLLSQSLGAAAAATAVFQLEQIRVGFLSAHAWDLIEAAGLPKAEVAVLWGFPVHSASVAELDPSVMLVPRPTAADELRIDVQGPVAATSVSAFALGGDYGSVVLVDLTALLGGSLPAGFPAVTATLDGGAIVIKGKAPFVATHQYGVFMMRARDPGQPPGPPGLTDDKGRPLVPSPVSKLLTLEAPLADAAGHSTISTVADADAVMLEAGRAQLASFFDSAGATIPGIQRDTLVYCFAFEWMAP
jgi:hypothetical protein